MVRRVLLPSLPTSAFLTAEEPLLKVFGFSLLLEQYVPNEFCRVLSLVQVCVRSVNKQ